MPPDTSAAIPDHGTGSAAALDEVRVAARRPGEAVEMSYSLPAAPRGGGVLLCSPQPMLGGDLDNNVMRALAGALARSGRPVARFDYRGVGNSRDVDPSRSRFEYWREVDRRGDFAAAIADAREALARARRLFEVDAIGGYSFGAWIASRLACEVAPAIPLLLVAPPLSRLDFSTLSGRSGATLLVAAESDALDPPPALDVLQARFPGASIARLPGVDHFFRGAEHEVSSRAVAFLDSIAGGRTPAP